MYEFIGIVADVFIIVGFLFNDTTKIRSFNILGSLLFILYGCLIGSVSLVILNVTMVAIHLIKLIKDTQKEEQNG